MDAMAQQDQQASQDLIDHTGPTDPSNRLSAYGRKYNTTSGSISLGVLTQTQIPLATRCQM